MFSDLKPAEVLAAGTRVRPLVRATRLIPSEPLSAAAGAECFLKLENEQITGSFKVRGAINALATLDAATRARGVVTSSAGNHGLGVAWAARHFGIVARIFVPRTAPRVKRDGIAALGATVTADDANYDEAMATAKAFARDTGARYINPCLGDMLLAGQGTVALEVLETIPSPGTFVVPVGGGGLLGGCASLLRHVAPGTRIIGAQSERTAAMARSVTAGRVVEIPDEPTLADGLAGQIDDEGLDIGRHALDGIFTVTEEEIAETVAWLAREHDVTVEGSGAVGVALVRSGRAKPLTGPVVVVVSGGNIDPDRLAGIRTQYG